jgi:multidrug transporter EmrE-like cation transporter
MILNSLGVAIFGYVASQQGMGVSSGMMLAMNIVLNTLLGIYLFKDSLNQMQWLGLGMCLIGIVVLTVHE